MPLTYSKTPQLLYGGGDRLGMQKPQQDRVKYPARAQPMDSAPLDGSRPVVVWDSQGKGHWALHMHDSWRKVVPGTRDPRTGKLGWPTMTDEVVRDPIRWSSS